MNRAQRRQAARQNRKAGIPNTPVGVVSGAPAPDDAANLRRDLENAVRLHQAGDPVRAIELYQRILDIAPDHAEAMNYMGVAAGALGQFENAVRLIGRSIELCPKIAGFHNNLGDVLSKAGKLEDAESAYRNAVKADPKFAAAFNSLGLVLAGQIRDDEAVRAFQKAIKVRPDFAEAHNNLGNLYFARKDFAEAEKSYRRAIGARPGYARAYNNLGVPLYMLGRLLEAETAHRKAIELQPQFPAAYNNLGNVLCNGGAIRESLDAYYKALEFDPRSAGTHSNLIFTMGLDGLSDASQILAECRRWDEQHVLIGADRRQPHGNDGDPDRRLRVGYVSGDFRDHAVAHFVEPLFAAHDRAAVEVFAYADVDKPDDVSARLEILVDRWIPIAGVKDTDLAGQIRTDGIDILIDLSGHTAGNRLLTFAEKPAPVQASWLGYGGTTGLEAMDYRITDAVTDPEGTAEAQHSETLVRLPNAFLCYQPPSDAPTFETSPAAKNGYITFGSFNSLAKVTPEAVSTWARVLGAVPGSHLIIKGRPFTESDIRRRYLDVFAAAGIDEDRVELLAQLPSRQEYLAVYNRVDIILDTFPYNGGTTTCEALWMGVPVVTLYGDRTVSRMSASMLGQVGMSDLVAQSEADYVGIAARLAGDPARLVELRAGLRPRMQESPMCDAPAFARAMEAAYRDIWRRWCAGAGGEG